MSTADESVGPGRPCAPAETRRGRPGATGPATTCRRRLQGADIRQDAGRRAVDEVGVEGDAVTAVVPARAVKATFTNRTADSGRRPVVVEVLSTANDGDCVIGMFTVSVSGADSAESTVTVFDRFPPPSISACVTVRVHV